MIARGRLTPSEVEEVRKCADISRSEFARILNVSITAVRNWESGRSSPNRTNEAAIRELDDKLARMEAEEESSQFAETLFGLGLLGLGGAILSELLSG
jgi:transcriptional regulator with XRE-family HTH domain